jgi:hypothetical protein
VAVAGRARGEGLGGVRFVYCKLYLSRPMSVNWPYIRPARVGYCMWVRPHRSPLSSCIDGRFVLLHHQPAGARCTGKYRWC